MAELVMDNPFSASGHANYAKSIADVRECIDRMRVENEDSGIPLTDSSQNLQRFCAKLEFLLQSGLKPKSSLLGGKKDYWNYICDCVSNNKSLNDGIRFVKANSEVKTNLGRGRALIRFALVHQRLADTLQQCVYNKQVTKDWYTPKAVWFQDQAASDVITALYDLNDLQFDLDSRGYDLDTSWPTFARNQFSGLQAWQPPSRTISIGSLNSNVQDQSIDADRISQMEQTENEKFSAEHRCEELTEENAKLKDRILTMQLEANERLKSTSEFEVMCGKLANELALKEETWGEREKLFKAQLEAAKSGSSSSDSECQELRVKIKILEKEKKALQLDLTCLQKEMGAKVKVDTVKNRLIDMQDRKIGKQGEEVNRLRDRVDGLVTNKTADTEQVVKASKQMETLSQQLDQSCAAYQSVVANNKELTTMLHSVEEKGTAIGKMAKEKLTKYKQENDELKERLSALELGNADADTKTLINALKAECQEKESSLSEKDLKLEEQADQIGQLEKTLSELKTQSIASDNGSGENATEAENQRALWCQEKEELTADIADKTRKVEELKKRLSDKVVILETCEKQMEAEKALLEQQMEGQGREIEQLKLELTALSKLLEQSGLGEICETDRLACVQTLTRTKTELEKSLASSQASNTELLEQAALAANKLQEAVEELRSSREEKVVLNESLQGVETESEQWREKFEEKSSQFNDLLTSFNGLESQLGLFESQLAQNTNTVQTLNTTVEDKDRMLQLQGEQCSSMNEKLDLLQKALSETEASRDKVQTQLEDKQGQMDSLQSQLTEASASLLRLENHKSDLEKLNQDNENKLKELIAEMENKDAYISKKETDVKQNSENFEELETKLTGAETYKKLLEEKIRTLTEAKELETKTFQSEVGDLRMKSQEQEGCLIETKAQNLTLAQKVERLESDIKASESERKGFVETKTKLGSKIEVLEQNCDVQLQEITTLKAENATLSERADKMESINAEMMVKSDELEEEKEHLRSRADETSTLQNEILAQVDETNKQLKEKETEVEELKSQLLLLGKEKEALSTDLENSASQVSSLTEQVDNLEKGRLETTEDFNKTLFELKEKIGGVDCENEALRKELSETISSKESLFAEMTEKLQASNTQFTELEPRYAEECRKLEDLQGTLSARQEKLDECQVRLQEKETELLDMTAKSSDTEEKLSKSLTDQESEQSSRIEELEGQLAQLQSDIEKKDQEYKSSKETYEQQIKSINFQLSTEQMQHSSVVQEFEDKVTDQTALQDKVSTLEGAVEEMETRLQEAQTEAQTQASLHKQQVAELQEEVSNKERECQVISEEIVKKSQLLEKQREERESIQKKLEKVEAENLKGVADFKEKNASLTDENDQLKKKLIQLIHEKDQLWKKSDKLEYQQRIRKEQVWADSSNVLECTKCNSAFGLLLRRHHCRLCGQIYCYYCCNNWVMTSFSNKKERVCEQCLMEKSHLESASEGEDSDVEGPIDQSDVTSRGSRASSRASSRDLDSVEIPELKSPKWNEKLVLNPAEFEDLPESVQRDIKASTSDTNTHIDKDHSNRSTSSHDEETLLSMTDESKSGRLKQGNSEFQSGAIAGAKKPTLAQLAKSASESSKGSQSDEGSSKGAASAEPYDLITEEELKKSSDDSVPDPYTHTTGLLAPADFTSGFVEAEPELWIAAGRAHAVPILIPTPGMTLCWSFTTSPKDINFSLLYRENEWKPLEEVEVLVPMCKCNSHKKAIEGELSARKAGLYTLVFDNKASRFTSKNLSYTLKLQEKEEATEGT